jgi:hypothetical protein
MPPLTLTGIKLYTHLAMIKLLIAHIQTPIARETVTNRTGIRRIKATPTQKRENRRAVMKDRAMVPRAKEAKRAMGAKERMIWTKMKDYWF